VASHQSLLVKLASAALFYREHQLRNVEAMNLKTTMEFVSKILLAVDESTYTNVCLASDCLSCRV